MGVTFRSGGYIKHIRFLGGRTIKDGEAAAIWNSNGIHTQIIGPKRVWLYNSTIRFLTRHRAQSHQYLRVSYCDGRIEHILGPAVLYQNPAYHDSVSVEDGLRLNSDLDCVVVTFSSSLVSSSSSSPSSSSSFSMKKKSTMSDGETFNKNDSSTISKRIIYGPTLFIPQPSEFVQTFSWSKANKLSSNSNNNKDKDTFQILHTSGTTPFKLTIPTVDGYTFDISLVLSYITTSIDNLIQNKDPIDQLYNGLCVDSQTIGDVIPSTSLIKSKKQDLLSTLSQVQTYPSLLKAANKCGLEIESIQVTTITLCPSLCDQINSEQTLNANIQSEVAKKTHSYKLHQMEMEAKQTRIENEAELKMKEVKTNDELDIKSHTFKLAALERKIELDKCEAEAMRDVMKVKEDAVLEFMVRMKQMGVDMTKFMTTYGGIEMAEKVIGKSDVLQRKKIVQVPL